MRRFLDVLAAAALTLAAAGAFAQAQPAASAATAMPAAKPAVQEDLPPPAPGAAGGIQGQNIFDVKPEVKRDASSDPDYLKQNNGQRNAVQPGNNAPMWRGVQAGKEGYSSLPKSEAPEAGILIQGPVQYPGSRLTSAGEAWRQVRNQWVIPYGAALLAIAVLALALLYFTKGPLGQHTQDTGRKIERFTPFERAAHWSNAIAFCALAISGLVMAFGKFFLLPVMGLTLFGFLTYVLKTIHNFMGPLFVVSLVIIFLTFLKDNFPQRGDLRWILSAGGLFSKHEPPSYRFNAGEKGIFWLGVFLLGTIVVVSGLVMDKLVPTIDYVRGTMQVTHMVHATAAMAMMAVFIGHIYMGTIGMRGAYGAMRRGWVDESWAKEHHAYWYEDIKAGKIPAERSRPVAMVDKSGDLARPA
ncbi:formate dehydrogenase subunit gamma [Ramlibacter sp. XY19]|uniref:formate dehydrogenase subunit gamma n=1 Tax=Ramlibacter paludis TaxID=2908000 RepID=UPI0023D99BDC|nr:formate dehydrogenase subunit gamma [Ramlibacter paludis]MCG2592124.1 formate dehydrogenase subunit gamma [Ramlibacter paludis]